MKDDESDGSIYIYIYIQLIDINHIRQSYLTLYAVCKTFNTTK